MTFSFKKNEAIFCKSIEKNNVGLAYGKVKLDR